MTVPDGRIDVAILGAGGLIGQEFVRLLASHPWFRVTELVGSERTAGVRFEECVVWQGRRAMPERAGRLTVKPPCARLESRLVFSALPGPAARETEPRLRARGHVVFTNAGPHRFGDGRVPIIPELNGDRLPSLLFGVAEGRGAIVPNPNCVVAGIAPPLAALDDAFGIREIVVTTLQALSGAGSSGVSALTGIGNVVPHIEGEAGKIVRETRAIAGLDAPMSVCVNRVPVRDGHLASLRVKTRSRPDTAEAMRTLGEFRGRSELPDLPSAPDQLMRFMEDRHRPQPGPDLEGPGGMTISVGPVAADALFDIIINVLVDNRIRGAAGGSILNAELSVARGLIDGEGWRAGRPATGVQRPWPRSPASVRSPRSPDTVD